MISWRRSRKTSTTTLAQAVQEPGPRTIKRPFREAAPYFFPRKRSLVVTRAILAVFIFEVGPELAVEPIRRYVAGTEPTMPQVFALTAFRFFWRVL